jgi:hypothetical protein
MQADMMTFEVLTAKSVKMAVFSDAVLYGLVDVDRRFRGAYCPYHPDDGGSKHI